MIASGTVCLMSLVVQMVVGGHPLLIGDILVSGLETEGHTFHVPTIGNITKVFPEGSGFVPKRLCQKIAMIGDNIMVGWAGNLIAARTTIKGLAGMASKIGLTVDDIVGFISSEMEGSEAKAGFVGFLRDAAGYHQFRYGGEVVDTERYGSIGVLGSGAADVVSLLKKCPVLKGEEVKPSSSQEQVVIAGLGLVSSLLGHELTMGNTLSSYYGGGFEVAAVVDGRFQKFSNVSHSYWYGEFGEEGLGLNLYQHVRNSYSKDLMFVWTATTLSPDLINSRYDLKSFAISPVYRDIRNISDEEVAFPREDPVLCCHNFTVKDRRNRIHSCTQILPFQQRHSCSASFDENGARISFDFDWIFEVTKKLSQRFSDMGG